MREFKFRAWDNVADEMLYAGEDTEVIFTLGSEGIQCTDIRNVMPSGEGVGFPEHYIYMQYTGLKDKNGNDVYESDICEIGNQKYVVVYERGAFWFVRAKHRDMHSLLYGSVGSSKVIGNVYENPELITKE
jgi:uncharacterized phage protein (TIGR01671 family)